MKHFLIEKHQRKAKKKVEDLTLFCVVHTKKILFED